jgi:hypothetical protein
VFVSCSLARPTRASFWLRSAVRLVWGEQSSLCANERTLPGAVVVPSDSELGDWKFQYDNPGPTPSAMGSRTGGGNNRTAAWVTGFPEKPVGGEGRMWCGYQPLSTDARAALSGWRRERLRLQSCSAINTATARINTPERAMATAMPVLKLRVLCASPSFGLLDGAGEGEPIGEKDCVGAIDTCVEVVDDSESVLEKDCVGSFDACVDGAEDGSVSEEDCVGATGTCVEGPEGESVLVSSSVISTKWSTCFHASASVYVGW